MARKGAIDELYDLDRLQKEHAVATAFIDDFIQKVNAVKPVKVSLEAATNTAGTLAGIDKLNKGMADYTAVSAKAQAAAVKASTALKNEAAARDKNASALLKEQKLQDSTTKNKEREEKARAKNAKEIEREANARKKEEKAVLDALNDYNALSKAYADAALRAKTLALATGDLDFKTPAVKEAIAQAKNYKDILDKVNQATGNFSGNVGNYSSAFRGLNTNFQQLARELPSLGVSASTFFLAISNNLPMFIDSMTQARGEIARLTAEGRKAPSMFQVLSQSIFSIQTALTIGVTLLTLYGSQLVKWIGSLFSAKAAVDALKASQDILNEAFAGTEFKEAVKSIDELRINIDLAKQGLRDKSEVLEEYNKGVGETIGQVNSLDEAEQKLISHGEAYVQMTLYKAAAQLALGKAAEKATEAAIIEEKKLEEFRNSVRDTRISSGGTGGLGTGAFNAREYDRETERIKAAQEKRRKDLADAERKQGETFRKIASDFQKQAAQIAKDNGFNFQGDNSADAKAADDAAKKRASDAKKRADELKKIRDEEAKDAFDRNKKNLEEEIKFQKLIADARLPAGGMSESARKEQLRLEKELIDLTANYELYQTDVTQKQLEEIRLGKYENLSQKQLAIVEERNRQEIEAEIQLMSELIQIRQQIDAQLRGSADKIIKSINEAKDREAQALLEATTTEINRARRGADERLKYYNDAYAADAISKEKYDQLKEESENRYLAKSIRNQIDYYKNLLILYATDNKVREDALNKIADLEAKFAAIGQSDKDKKLKKVEDEAKAIAEAYKNLANELQGLTFDFFTANLTRQKNELQDQIDLIDERKRKDIEAENQRTQSATDRAANIATIEARSNAEKEQLQRRQRQLDIEKAKFDKANAITGIIQNTAILIAKYGLISPLGAIAAATGAVMIARVLAQPIPRYAEGTDNHPGGKAIVGDGGKKELILTPDGRYMVTQATPHVVDLPKYSVVLPDAQAAMTHSTTVNNITRPPVFQRPTDTGMKTEFEKLRNTIKNKRETHVSNVRAQDVWLKSGDSWQQFLK